MTLRAILLIGFGAVRLLRRMRREFDSTGTLSMPTVVAMYATYAAHAAVTAQATYERTLPLPVPPRPAATVGSAMILSGGACCVAGMSRFTGAEQVSGTEVGGLVTGGIYRYSRNPQYVGYILALTGLGVARRSAAVLALAAGGALAFRYWVPIEERHLDQALGKDYSRYRDETARWLSLTSASPS